MAGLRSALELMGARAPPKLDAVLSVLRELVVAPLAKTREVTGSLLERLVPLCSESVLRNVILPSITTLSNDESVDVRKQVIYALGTLLSSTSDEKILETVSFQLDALLDVQDPVVSECVLSMLTETVLGVKADYRDRCLLSKIRKAAVANSEVEDEAAKARVASATFLAYKTFLECGPSIEVLAAEVLLGLEVLITQPLSEDNLKSVTTAIATIRTKAGIAAPKPLSASSDAMPIEAPATAAEPADEGGNAPAAAMTADEDKEEEKKEETVQSKAKSLFDRFSKFAKEKKQGIEEQLAAKSDNEGGEKE